jgi:ABC-type Mn2+/Zn2+ transport system ATPase subunit
MLDRKAEISNFWRHIKDRKGFQQQVTRINIHGNGIMDSISLDINSALTTICGRNGAGKTTVLKAIYSILSGKESQNNFHSVEKSFIAINERSSNTNILYGQNYTSFDDVFYLEPADDAIIIKSKIINDVTFFEDYIEGGDESPILNEYLGYIKKILSNDIERITVIEIEGILDKDRVLPYFQVYKSGLVYGSLEMGQGEHKILYLIWSMITVKTNSILILEEPEAFLCSKSQEHLMDFMASIIDRKKLHIFLSTHSDHILRKQNVTSCSIVKRNNADKICLTSEKGKSKYLAALGLETSKKGVLLVEDEFASLVTHTILNDTNSSLLQDFYIDQLNGESHILQVAKHYSSKNMQIVCLLDADQKGKLKENSYLLPITYLPARNVVAPEQEIISYVKDNVDSFVETIVSSKENIKREVVSLEENHHDWFDELSERLNFKNSDILKVSAISLWVKGNRAKIDKFVHVLENLNEKLDRKIEKYNESYIIRSNDIIYDLHPEMKEKMNLDFYNGKSMKGNLQFSKGYEVFYFDI